MFQITASCKKLHQNNNKKCIFTLVIKNRLCSKDNDKKGDHDLIIKQLLNFHISGLQLLL